VLKIENPTFRKSAKCALVRTPDNDAKKSSISLISEYEKLTIEVSTFIDLYVTIGYTDYAKSFVGGLTMKRVMPAFFAAFFCLFANVCTLSAMEDAAFTRAGKCRFLSQELIGTFETARGDVQLPALLVADSAYDQTFKKIFAWDNTVGDITGKSRTMSILNSIFYPHADENGLKIRGLEQLPNESTRFNEKTPLGMLKFDVVCRCSCWSLHSMHEVKIFDIEMQTGYEAEFAGRLFDYGNVLRAANDHLPIVILAFLNYHRRETDDSAWLGLFYRDINTGNPINPVEGVVDTHCVDLSKKSSLLFYEKPIIIGGERVNSSGREWLKLLSMRHWAAQCGGRYIVPNCATDPAVRSALTILASVSESDLQGYMHQESTANAMLQGAREDGKLEQAIETTKRMLSLGITDLEMIAQSTGLSSEMVTEISSSMAPTGQ
jgi:hypothetical protein